MYPLTTVDPKQTNKNRYIMYGIKTQILIALEYFDQIKSIKHLIDF